MSDPEDDERGRVNADMAFEDAMRLMLNTDLRESAADEPCEPDDDDAE